MSKIKDYTSGLTEGPPPEGPSEVKVANERPADPNNTSVFPSPTDDSGGFLRSFLNAHPFIDLFEHIADRLCTGRNDQIKNAKLKVLHPYFFTFCMIADIIVRTIVVVVLIGVATWAALKIVR